MALNEDEQEHMDGKRMEAMRGCKYLLKLGQAYEDRQAESMHIQWVFLHGCVLMSSSGTLPPRPSPLPLWCSLPNSDPNPDLWPHAGFNGSSVLSADLYTTQACIMTNLTMSQSFIITIHSPICVCALLYIADPVWVQMLILWVMHSMPELGLGVPMVMKDEAEIMGMDDGMDLTPQDRR